MLLESMCVIFIAIHKFKLKSSSKNAQIEAESLIFFAYVT